MSPTNFFSSLDFNWIRLFSDYSCPKFDPTFSRLTNIIICYAGSFSRRRLTIPIASKVYLDFYSLVCNNSEVPPFLHFRSYFRPISWYPASSSGGGVGNSN